VKIEALYLEARAMMDRQTCIRQQIDKEPWPDWIPGIEPDPVGEENARLR
jgi:hypothetical protein